MGNCERCCRPSAPGRALPGGIPPPAGPWRGARGLKVLQAWLLCLLLLGLALRGAASRAHQRSMETRTPDLDPAWYMGRRIRPVGRFGRRRTALRDVPELSLWHQRAASPWQAALSPPRVGDSPQQEE
ncbi:PREDICTED: prolactin-releasing peptide [Miniopterus natalensis]|uniref:prolactin-releasing peptide n=1 Tax=Miniopterus natalensis TaxID=291302 RepID=UPI0007A6DA56|nr:PREDICTED: prolactin-releasing peptide [Miniopterus natalensis]